MEHFETGCEEPIYQYGGLYATRHVGAHDWRLFAREPSNDFTTEHQENAPGYGNVVIEQVGWNETWYCTRCRLVSTRLAPLLTEEAV